MPLDRSANQKRTSRYEYEKKQMELSEEERQRRSENALELHKQGKLGGANYGRLGGRPRIKRSSEIVAEAAINHADDLLKVLLDGISPSEPIYIRLQALKLWHMIESAEVKQQFEELKDHTDKEKLIDAILALSEEDEADETRAIGEESGTTDGSVGEEEAN